MPTNFNNQIIAEFRTSNGRVGGHFEGARLLLLTTTGARTGAPHTTPLGYLPDGARNLIIGSAGGGPKHPDWYHNLVAEPRVSVEDGVFSYDAYAVVLRGDERDSLFARAVEADAGWGAYQDKTDRVLPVVALEAIPGPPRFAGGLPSAAAALTAVHDAFRRELALIRTEVAAAGGGVGAQLRVNCLTLCAGLSGHHTKEDDGLFPYLTGRYPDLNDTMARLRTEHDTIAALLADLQAVLADPAVDPARLLAEVRRLTGEVEAHLRYEEHALIPVLGGGSA